MADQARLNDLLDLVDQARQRGDKDTEAKATAAFKRESIPDDVRIAHENRLLDAQNALTDEKKRALPMTLGDKVAAGTDLGLTGVVRGIYGPIAEGAAGTLARATLQDPTEWKKAVSDSLYSPHTDAGQGIYQDATNAVGDAMAPVGRVLATADKGYRAAMGDANADQGEALLGGVSDVAQALPVVGVAAKASALAKAAALAKASRVAETPIAIAEAAGHKMLPSSVKYGTGMGATPSRLATIGETVGGESQLKREFTRHDLSNYNDLAAQGIGLEPKTILTDEAIAKAKKPFVAIYNRIRRFVPPSTLSDDTIAKLSKAGLDTDNRLGLPDAVNGIKERLLKGDTTWTSPEVLKTMSALRENATRDLMNADSTIVERGRAQLAMAKALEDHLEEQLANNHFIVTPDEFKAARTGFAKIYTVDNARYGYDVDPQAIAKLGRETKLAHGQSSNTGELGIIEHLATHDNATSLGKVAAEQNVSPASKGGAIGRITLALPRKLARMGVSATRDVDTSAVPFRDRPALAKFFPQEKPRPPIDLKAPTPPEGTGLTPTQAPLHGLGDMNIPMAESTQNPRTSLNLKQPPGPVLHPLQRTLDLGQGDDYLQTAAPPIDEIIAMLKKQGYGK